MRQPCTPAEFRQQVERLGLESPKPITTPAAAKRRGLTPAQFRRLAKRAGLVPVGWRTNPHDNGGPKCPLWSAEAVEGLASE